MSFSASCVSGITQQRAPTDQLLGVGRGLWEAFLQASSPSRGNGCRRSECAQPALLEGRLALTSAQRHRLSRAAFRCGRTNRLRWKSVVLATRGSSCSSLVGGIKGAWASGQSVNSDVHMLPCFNYAIYSCSLTVQKISSTNHAVVGMNKMCNRLKGHKCMIILLYFEYAIQYNRL